MSDGNEFGFHGCFHEVRPSELIVQTFTFEGMPDEVALERLEFEDLGGGRTRLTATSLVDGFATIDDGEVWLRGVNIPEYKFGTHSHGPLRNRKLLMHRREIAKLEKEVANSGRTLVPLSIYFSDGYAKVEIAVATGKKDWDKRQTIAERDANREAQRALSARNKGRR